MVSRRSCFTDEETEPEWNPNLPRGQPGEKIYLFLPVLPPETQHLSICASGCKRLKTSGPVAQSIPAAALPPLGVAARLTPNGDVHSIEDVHSSSTFSKSHAKSGSGHQG